MPGVTGDLVLLDRERPRHARIPVTGHIAVELVRSRRSVDSYLSRVAWGHVDTDAQFIDGEVVRQGKEVTILTYSRMRHHVMQAVKTLEKEGYDPEVIDLISLKPLDMETIGQSIRKTHRVIIVEECMKTGGIAAELTALITEQLFDELDAPVLRLATNR